MILRVGTVTIGQTPRVDLVPEIASMISAEIEVLEKGVLDGLSLEEIERLRPEKDEESLTTRMRDGTEVIVGRSRILPRFQEKISELNKENVVLIALLCAAEGLPRFQSEKLLIKPADLQRGVLSSIAIKGKLGVMVPLRSHMDAILEAFRALGFETIGAVASPFQDEGAIAEAAGQLKAQADLVVMNCMGYTLAMKRKVREITGKPVLLVRSLLARAIEELVVRG